MRCGCSRSLVLIALLASIGIPPAWGQPGPGKLSLANRWLSTRDMDADENALNNWLDIEYQYRGWRGGLRFEMHNPRNPQLHNDWVAQRYLQYEQNWLKARAGTFYERLGRGLVFHAFEIQSQTVDRVERNLAIDRNIDGLNLQILLDRLEVTGIWGKPLKTLSSDRGNPLGGGEIRFRPAAPFMIGGSLLRLQEDDFRGNTFHIDMRAVELEANLNAVDLYVEVAQKQSSQTSANPNGSAVYANLNLYGERIGLNAEFKRYEDFNTPFNNPPALVKTHSFALLNRHTHSLNANDEIGYQLEAYLNLSERATLTLHAAGADNLDNNPRRRFREYFIESHNEWGDRITSRLVLDYSKDRPVGDLSRWTAAGEIDVLLTGKNSLLGDIQLQHLNNENSGKYQNYFVSLAYSRSPWLTLSLQNEWTADPGASQKNWTSGVVNLKFGQHHDVLLTAGARPAGLVCSGGICFFLPEFRGIDLRWNMRL